MLWIIYLIIHVSSKELVYFLQVARHGARSPSGYMEWDQNRWFDGESVLSGDGMRQHYLIGKHLRKRYVHSGFLSSEFNNTQIKLVANEVERTQRSLASQMLGLYPTRTWKKPLLKNPSVPIKIKNNAKLPEDFQIPGFYMKVSPGNTMLRAKDGCPEYKEYTKKRKSSNEMQGIFKKYSNIISKVATKYNISFVEAEGRTMDIIASIRSNSFAGFGWDKDFDESFCDQAQELYMEYKHYVSFSPDFIARFTSSDFFEGLYGILDDVRNGKNTEKATIFLAHDTTLFSIFSGLGVWLEEQPPFATVLLLEVFKDGNKFEISWVYNMKRIIVPGFSKKYAKIDEFMNFIKTRTLEDSDKACKDIKNLTIENFKTKSLIAEENNSVILCSNLSISLYLAMIIAIISLFKCRSAIVKIFQTLKSQLHEEDSYLRKNLI